MWPSFNYTVTTNLNKSVTLQGSLVLKTWTTVHKPALDSWNKRSGIVCIFNDGKPFFPQFLVTFTLKKRMEKKTSHVLIFLSKTDTGELGLRGRPFNPHNKQKALANQNVEKPVL